MVTLKDIIKGKINKPLRVFVYGVPGIGKSTFASKAPSPIFIGTEGGTSRLDVDRLPEPKTWEDFFQRVGLLTDKNHGYKTVVIDTVNWLEPLVYKYVCENNKYKGKAVDDITGFDYGVGYNLAMTQWHRFIRSMDELTDYGINVIMLAHPKIKNFKNPKGPDYDRYRPAMYDGAADILMQWSEDVLYAEYEQATYEIDGRMRGTGTNKRIVHTVDGAAWSAKNRASIPEILPFEWEEYADAVGIGSPATSESIMIEINELLPLVSDSSKLDKISKAIRDANSDSNALSRILNRLRVVVGERNSNGQ
jgi:hypothetical protein